MQHSILETNYWILKLADNQAYLGYSILILKSRKPSLAELSEEESNELFRIVKAFEISATKTLSATLFNWTCLMNASYKQKPYDPEVHFHVRPRYDHEVEIAGEIFTDPNFAHHYDRKIEKEITPPIADTIISKIKSELVF
ncbi:MAG: histidine triad protein [Patescibacteria group bacterium]|nr:histidine triad protein [Patescibacteria group bacterium]